MALGMWTMMEIDSSMRFMNRDLPYANYLPDELLLQVLDFLPQNEESQITLANFVLVSRYVAIYCPL